ncbi:MAG: hypothetical protein J0H78_05010 [Rhizobiales bacterium]|mgnify:CR=1 FL=1|nr:hypothetical protein [Hyphomicrobiales bacterium]OJY41096.1 MAG: hypothetical protein BGP08_04610 [Rhizobiales bacterium 64-17]
MSAEDNSNAVNLTRGFRVFIIRVFELVCVISIIVSFIVGFFLMTMYARYGALLLGFFIFALTVLGTIIAVGFAFILLDIADNVRAIARMTANGNIALPLGDTANTQEQRPIDWEHSFRSIIYKLRRDG